MIDKTFLEAFILVNEKKFAIIVIKKLSILRRKAMTLDYLIIRRPITTGAGATFDWLFFNNSKLINFDD